MKTMLMTRVRRAVGFGVLLSTVVGVAIAGFTAAKTPPTLKKGIGRPAAQGQITRKPDARWIENRGQWDSRAKFLGRGSGIDTWVTETSIYFDAYKARITKDPTPLYAQNKSVTTKAYRQGQVIRMEFVGGNAADSVNGVDELGAKFNYLKGNNFVTGSRTYKETLLKGVYPGVDVRVYFENSKPRYDFVVAPNTDPSIIRLNFAGADSVSVKQETSLELGTKLGSISVGGLYAYQQTGPTKVAVPVSFSMDSDGRIGFKTGRYDRTKPLIIDPVVFSSFLGGVGSVDVGYGVAVDRFNKAYCCGYADAPTFPTTIGAYDENLVDTDGYISKFTADGSDLEYSTYIGGSTVTPTAPLGVIADDYCLDIKVDFDGNAYVCGQTASNDFPTSPGAPQPAYTIPPLGAGGNDFYEGFVLKLNPLGNALGYGTYVGGNRFDYASALALGPDRSVYVVGATQSASFPTVNPLQGAMKGNGDGFVTKINPAGTAFAYSSFIGGTDSMLTHNDDDFCVSVAVDTDSNAYVLARTAFNDAPKKAGSFDTTVNGLDCLVLKLDPTGGSLVYGTFLGGNDSDYATDIDIDATGNAFITGITFSFNYPRTLGVFDRVYNLAIDCFITKLNRLGNGLVYSTFLGTVNGAQPLSIAVDDLGFAHVAGFVSQSTTTGRWLPVTPNADYPDYNGPADPFLGTGDAFLMVMNDTGTGLQYCGYLGGSYQDVGQGIALDNSRNDYVTGYTQSSAEQQIVFPTTAGAFKEGMPQDAIPNSLPDAFLAKIKTRIPITISSLTIDPNSVAGGQSSTGTVTISGPASNGGQLVTLTNNNNSIVTTPVSFVIPAGQTSGTFNIDTNPNLVVREVVEITAMVEGDTKSASITVSPWLEAFTLSNTTVVGGNPVAARVTLSHPAPNGGITVNLASTVPSAATVPGTVTVLAGTTTAVFDVTTLGVNSLQTVDLTASLFGLTITQRLDVVPASLFAVNLNPTRVSGGTPSAGIVQLDGNAPPGGLTVALSSNDPAVQVPASVFIPAQSNSAAFTATTSVVNVNTTATITASANSVQVSANLDVLVANLISLTIAPDSILGGNSTTGTVALDHPAATGGVTITLASSNPGIATVPATVTIPSGSTNTTFAITTVVVPATTNVTISADRDGAGPIPPLTANLEVREVAFTLDITPSTVPGGTPSVGTVTLDEAAPTGGITINLVSSAPGVANVPATVTVAAGSTTATFPVTTSSVGVDTTVTITGTFLLSFASDTVTVTAPGPVGLSFNPSSVVGGASSIGTVTLTSAAPAGGVTVTLSSNSGAVLVPGSVTVPQGAISANFVANTTGVLVDTTATVTATIGANSVQATLTVTAAALVEIRFSPSRVRGPASTIMLVRLNSVAPPGGAVVSLTSSDPTLATIPATVTVTGTQILVTVPTRRVSRTLATQVTGTYGNSTASAILTVIR